MLNIIILLVLSFVILWMGSGLAISSVEKLSRRVHISFFIISFFALGLLTSLAEISVGIFSVIDGTPSISVGNLIGASTVLTLLILPLQVLINKGTSINLKDSRVNTPFSYLVISLPVILVLDRRLTYLDSILMIFAYIALLFTISNKRNLVEKVSQSIVIPKVSVYKEVSKIALGALLVIAASKLIVENFLNLADLLNIAPFLIGLLVLSIGTNIPELSILVRSHLSKKQNIAVGDYLGSATLNTVILSGLVFANMGEIFIENGLKLNILLLPIGAILFLFFAKNQKFEKREAFIMFLLYVLFVILEFAL